MKKIIAEAIGTAMLVVMGCGTAMLMGCDPGSGSGYLATAFAFGLAIVCIAYSVGGISGGHVNPAVSFGVLLSGGMDLGEFISYIIAQFVGAIAGTALLGAIFGLGGVEDVTTAFGANGLDGVNGNFLAGLLVEILLTFIFVLLILFVTSKRAKRSSLGGLLIGLALTGVHILGIGLTGTSVNPARSFGPALFAAFTGNLAPLAALPVFIIGPMAGAALAAVVNGILEGR